MKKITVLSFVSMLLFTAACSHEPTMSEDLADLQLDNTSVNSAAAPVADSVPAESIDMDLTPPNSPQSYSPRPHRASRKGVKHRASKKKVAKHKHKRHSRGSSELARSR